VFTALNVMGMKDAEVMNIFRLVAGILHVGNIQFAENGNYSQIADKQREPSYSLQEYITAISYMINPESIQFYLSSHKLRDPYIYNQLIRTLRRLVEPIDLACAISMSTLVAELAGIIIVRLRFSSRVSGVSL